jgi:hypothetical protein
MQDACFLFVAAPEEAPFDLQNIQIVVMDMEIVISSAGVGDVCARVHILNLSAVMCLELCTVSRGPF